MENVYVVNGIHCWHTTHLRGNWNNNKKFIYHLKMPSERLNGKKKKLFLKFTYRIYFNLKLFLALCLVAKKMEENNLWQHHWSLVTYTYIYNTWFARPTSSKMKIPRPQINLNRNPPATNTFCRSKTNWGTHLLRGTRSSTNHLG